MIKRRRSRQWNVTVFHYVHRDIIKDQMCRKERKPMYNFNKFVHLMDSASGRIGEKIQTLRSHV